MAKRPSGLGGRGINALIATKQKAEVQPSENQVEKIAIEQIRAGRFQPRKRFDDALLQDLAESIQSQGLVQPIVLRKLAEQSYEIIAGERRWRAAKLAGLKEVSAIIRQVEDQDTLAMALIENIQREDLNPLEEAQALQRLQKEFELTQQELAEAVGQSRVGITNKLRLLKLPEIVQDWMHDNLLTMGHVRAILTLEESEQIRIAQQAIDQAWSVRQVEEAVQKRQQTGKENPEPKKKPQPDPNIQSLQQSISEKIGAKVQIKHGAKGKGKILIDYSSLDELSGILRFFE